MSWETDLEQNGFVTLSASTGSKRSYTTGIKRPRKENREIDAKEIEICLNCTEPKCRGYCDKIRKINNGRKRN